MNTTESFGLVTGITTTTSSVAREIGFAEFKTIAERASVGELLKGYEWISNKTEAFHYLCREGKVETIEGFIEKGFDVNGKDGEEATGLHHAALGGHVLAVKVLLAHGANRSLENNRSETALKIAERLGYERLVNVLQCERLKFSEVTERFLNESDSRSNQEPFTVSKFLQLAGAFIRASKEAQESRSTIVVGCTGEGKSTLCSYMLGCNYEQIKEGRVYKLITKDREIARRSDSITSQTQGIQTCSNPGFSPHAFTDCAGFLENRGEVYQIATDIAFNGLFNEQNKINTIVVVIKRENFQAAALPLSFLPL